MCHSSDDNMVVLKTVITRAPRVIVSEVRKSSKQTETRLYSTSYRLRVVQISPRTDIKSSR